MDVDSENDFLEEDYYSVLNLPKTATQEEITFAYRRLSKIFHPDKHVDENKKKDAEILFNKAQKAYEVLKDPHQRAIYDCVGVKGLKTEGWEIVHRTKTPQEIREEYEALARDREERMLRSRTNARCIFTAHIDATDIFEPNQYLEYDEDVDSYIYIPSIEMSSMSMSMSTEAPISLRDTIVLSGNISSRSGSVSSSYKRLLSTNGWVKYDITAGNGLHVGAKIFKMITKNVFGTIEGSLSDLSSGQLKPIGRVMLGTSLGSRTSGYISLGGQLSSLKHTNLSTEIEHNTEKSYCMCKLEVGFAPAISILYTWKFIEQDMLLRIYVKAGILNSKLEYGVEKKVSKFNTFAATVQIDVLNGVTLKLKFVRAGQTYIFPILLSHDIIAAPIFYATFVPFVSWFVAKNIILDPIMKEYKNREINKQREMNKKRMAQLRQEALSAINLMMATMERIVREETEKRGLIIILARYGNAELIRKSGQSFDEGSTLQPNIIDVTVPLQCLVKDSQLILHTTTKSQLPGFYDPCIGEDKVLSVKYMYRDLDYEIIINDSESLRIPRPRPHLSRTSTPPS
ncbi:dnaJ homolog subfamily C member 11 [Adelges cooleyi]|uniref:dnaJ homolog subfamily C member 11 n=1 Tax=Adelges cooleyi TaxID=133065 RepID=UPI00217FC905|nr:dnaJ homolog subfamily C member 11 [Adelges cooleyi]XP_050429849.1 dnaJ homolog subfamily C member 11 [Adelges cooleyi]XP_050429850.1 dnaJ homolog subfamily C member 11 [Adelges cooleyi]XP_050429851.1 dnaJ homolog subfamily C member 11 [Adelges cooleyi]XP_050429852.1 dnaJ homolog subfamily C member 11 [Adelges cooleyi]XP_050429853.1 dnaJ homolog subfamily C member 11 [Adelges cooleyi]